MTQKVLTHRKNQPTNQPTYQTNKQKKQTNKQTNNKGWRCLFIYYLKIIYSHMVSSIPIKYK